MLAWTFLSFRQECASSRAMFGIRSDGERYYADDPQGSEGFDCHDRTGWML